MNRSVKHLHTYTLVARDGELGSIQEMFFDDEKWTIRYLLADLEEGSGKDRVAVSPVVVKDVDWKNRTILVDLAQAVVAGSPKVAVEKSISRDKEQELSRYYGIPDYWNGVGLWGNNMYPGSLATEPSSEEQGGNAGREAGKAIHVHSTKEVVGCKIDATDGKIGHVEDLVVEERTWEIQFLVIDTRNWLPGKKVIVDTHWIDQVNWREGKVKVSLPRKAIRSATAI